MAQELKTSFDLFADVDSEKVRQYKKLAREAYNDNPIPEEFDGDIEDGLRETRKIAAEAKEKGISVEILIKQNLRNVPITYALIDIQNGQILGVGSIKNHEYILYRAQQANDRELVQKIQAAPMQWGCLEYICVDEKFRGRKAGRKILESLFVEANKFGLKNVGLYCAESELGFYTKVGLHYACFAEGGCVLVNQIK